MTDAPKSLLVYMVTVGEEDVFEALKLLKLYTPIPYKLKIWYDACDRGVDLGYIAGLLGHTDDVITSTKNQGLAACMGYGILYGNYDYLLWMTPDLKLHRDYWPKIWKPFEEVKDLGVSGEAWRAHCDPYCVDNFDHGIDGVALFNRTAIDAVGAIAPAFFGRGAIHTELHRRMVSGGFHFAAVNGLCDHGFAPNRQHVGRDQAKDWQRELEADNKVFERCAAQNYRGYRWWAKGQNVPDGPL